MASPSDDRFPKSARLRRRAEFLAVQGRGRRVYTPHYILVVRQAPDGSGRLGITVTKKVANAPGRNRTKRVLREVYRRNRARFPVAELVIIARPGAPKLGYAEALAELLDALPAAHRAAQQPKPPRRPRSGTAERRPQASRPRPNHKEGPS